MELFLLKKTIFIFLLSLCAAVIVFAQEVVSVTEQEVLEFMNQYNVTMFRNQEKLTLMHKKYKLSKLGKESVNGDIQGSMRYDAHIKGFGGEVILAFNDYQDFDGWIINGESNVYSRMDMNGYMFGTTEVRDEEGNLFATVEYTNVKIVKGNVGGGTYGITLSGKETFWLEWDKLIQPTIRNDE